MSHIQPVVQVFDIGFEMNFGNLTVRPSLPIVRSPVQERIGLLIDILTENNGFGKRAGILDTLGRAARTGAQSKFVPCLFTLAFTGQPKLNFKRCRRKDFPNRGQRVRSNQKTPAVAFQMQFGTDRTFPGWSLRKTFRQRLIKSVVTLTLHFSPCQVLVILKRNETSLCPITKYAAKHTDRISRSMGYDFVMTSPSLSSFFSRDLPSPVLQDLHHHFGEWEHEKRQESLSTLHATSHKPCQRSFQGIFLIDS